MGSGVGRMLWASLFFSIMSALIKAVSDTIPTAEIVLARCLLPLPVLVGLMRRRRLPLVPSNLRLVLWRSAFGTIAMGLSFYALGVLHLADAVLLQNVQPMLVALVAPFFLGERATWLTFASIAASLVGAAFILQPSLEVGNLGGVLMLLSALSSSFAMVSVRRLSADDPPLVIVTGFAAFSALVALPFAVWGFVMPSGLDLLALLGLAAAATVGQVLMTGAYAVESAPVVAAAGYVTILFGVVLGFVFWGEAPGSWSLVGGLLVLASGVALVWSRRHAVPHAYEAPGRI